MGSANREVFDRAARGYRAAFANTFAQVTPAPAWMYYELDGSMSTSETELFATMADADIPEFKDRRVYKDIKWYSFETTPGVRGQGVRVHRRDMRIDRWGAQMSAFSRQASYMRRTQRREMVSYLVNGFGGSKGLAYDGQFMFDDHQDNAGNTWTNAHALALSETNFDTVYRALRTSRWPDGVRALESAIPGWSVKLVVGPKLQTLAESIVQAERLDSGATNTRRGRATVEVIDDLDPQDPDFGAYDDYWFLIADIGMPEAKPLTFSVAEETELVEMSDPDNPLTFEDDHYRWGVRGEWGIGYRAPWVIQGSAV